MLVLVQENRKAKTIEAEYGSFILQGMMMYAAPILLRTRARKARMKLAFEAA